MRKIFFLIALIILLFPMQGNATWQKYYLYLGNSPYDSGNTTIASGVSTLKVRGGKLNGQTQITNQVIVEGYWAVQIAGVTPSQAQQGMGGDYSGTTFTFRYKESLLSDDSHKDKAQAIEIFSGPLSGDTYYQIPIYPEGMGIIWFEVVSGTTPLDGFDAILITK